LVNSRDIFLQIQALHCEFAEFLLHVGGTKEKFPEPEGEGNLVSRLVFLANTPPKHDISV
jgi:hypothetical protein